MCPTPNPPASPAPEPPVGQPVGVDWGRYAWPVAAVLCVGYTAERFANFPAWGLGVQLLMTSALTAVIVHWVSGTRVRRLSKALVFALIVVSQVHRLLGLPFVFFALVIPGLYLAWRLATPRIADRTMLAAAAIRCAFLVGAVAIPFALLQYIVWSAESISEAGVGLDGYEVAGRPFPPTMGDAWHAARNYEPFWMFSHGERWYPSRAEDYLKDPAARLVIDGRDAGSGKIVLDPATSDKAACRMATTRRCQVTLRCRDDSARCAKARPGQSVVYAHIIDNPLALDDYRPSRSLVGRVRRVIEYWVFYRYDAWKGWGGLFHQWHESDWEAVTVGLGKSEPLFVAFSSHCGGNWRPWGRGLGGMGGNRRPDGRLVALPGHPRGYHPMAFVADGTHATYPDDSPRQPDWDSCARRIPLLFHVATFGPTYGAGIRERLDQAGDTENFYGPTPIRADVGGPSVMRFHGSWAVEDHQHMISGDVRGGGPPSPPLQRLWTHPLSTIFCSDYWRPKQECPTS
jgi:hypothetical protein